MDETERKRAMAEHVFTRLVLSDLMVDLCMRADDPVAEAKRRAAIRLDALDGAVEKRGGDELSHRVLDQFETFWPDVLREVEERVRFRDQFGG